MKLCNEIFYLVAIGCGSRGEVREGFPKKVKVELRFKGQMSNQSSDKKTAHGQGEGKTRSLVLTYTAVTNKDLLYSTGNSTQYSVITYMEKASEKE